MFLKLRVVQGGVGCQRGTTLDSSIPYEGNKVEIYVIFKIYQSDSMVIFFLFFLKDIMKLF